MGDNLRTQVIKLAHSNPELRGVLLPLLGKTAFIDPKITLTKFPAGTKVKVHGQVKTVKMSGSNGMGHLFLYFTDGSQHNMFKDGVPEIVK